MRWGGVTWLGGGRWGGAANGGGKWGAVALSGLHRLTWGIEVDWDNDGLYESNEAHNVFSYSSERGRLNYLKSDGSGFEPVMTQQLTMQLEDSNGRYNIYNASSPLIGKLDGNQRIRIRVRDEATGVIWPVMVGRIDDIFSNYTDPPTATLRASGTEKLMKAAIINTGIVQTERFDVAIKLVLSTMPFPDGQNIDTTVSDSMPYYWAQNSAFDEANDLALAALGMFYVAADGRASYISRVATDSSVITFNDTDALRAYGVRSPSPREMVRNLIKVYAQARNQIASVIMWKANGTPLVPAGSSLTIWAQTSYNGVLAPAFATTTPVSGTDFIANASADGSGTNLTSSISVVVTTYAGTQKLVYSNSSGTDAYLTTAQLRGTVIAADPYTFAQVSSGSSIIKYTTLEMDLKSNWLQDMNTAAQQAAILLVALATLRQFPRIVVRGKPAKQFALDITNIVTLNLSQSGATGDYRTGYIKHDWIQRNGDVVDTTFFFEPNTLGHSSGSWVFPATLESTTVFS